jgi:N-acetylglucosamine-6-phosphate deacetylase
MTTKAITGARILADGIWLDDHALLLKDGRIAAIVAASAIPTDADIAQLRGGMLVAGFIDTQVNGGGGVLFNDQPNVKGIAAIAAAHRRFGTTAMLPTLISDDFDVIAAAIAAVDEAIASGIPGIIGIHIEGPFLNAGKRGIHNAAKFRTLDEQAIALLSSLKNGRTLVTLAPELAPQGAIATLVEAGVIVAAGHTLAKYEDIERGIAEGLSGVTHLFNAMSQLESRAPGVVGAAFDSDLICGIIVDSHHVHPASLRAAYRAKGADDLMLVTDAMPTVGSTEGRFCIGETEIVAEGGMLRSAGGTLAGSDLDMASAMRNCMSMMHVDLSAACQMASLTPARFLGLGADYGRLAPGYRADLVHLNDDLHVQATWIMGEMLQAQ